MHRALAPLIILAAAACSSDEDVATRFISPLDGQTGWSVDGPLVARYDALNVPPDYPMPEVMRVVDLEDGGLVPGKTTMGDGFLSFTPDESWSAGRFAWVVDMPEAVPHGPSLEFPDILEEPSVFDTTPRLDVLAGSIDAEGNTCVVLSRVTDSADDGTWTLSEGDVTWDGVVGYLVPRSEWGPDLTFIEGDAGVDVLCFTFEGGPTDVPDLASGDEIRLTWGDDGPWLIELSEGDIATAVQGLRRGAP